MSAISAIYEITRMNPTVFIVTIPVLFQLLQESQNNWVLIKLIKVLVEFCNAEPRLTTKLKPKLVGLLD